MLTKSKLDQPEEPIYVVNLIEMINNQTDIDRIEEESETNQPERPQGGNANSMWNMYLQQQLTFDMFFEHTFSVEKYRLCD